MLVITRFVDSYWYCTMWDRLLTHRKLTAVLSVCVLEKVWETHEGEIGQRLEYWFGVQEAVAEGAWFSLFEVSEMLTVCKNGMSRRMCGILKRLIWQRI